MYWSGYINNHTEPRVIMQCTSEKSPHSQKPVISSCMQNTMHYYVWNRLLRRNIVDRHIASVTCLTPYFCVGSSIMNIRAHQQPQHICITFVQRRPNVLTLGRRCLKVIQMFCVYWGGFFSDRHDCATIRLSIPLTVSHFQKYYIYKILCFRRCQVVISFPAHESPPPPPVWAL